MLGNLEPDETHLAVSYLVLIAAMFEFNRGNLTQNAIVNALSLSPADLAGFTTVYMAIFVNGTYDIQEFTDVIVLGSTRNRADPNGAPYYSKATVKSRLGL